MRNRRKQKNSRVSVVVSLSLHIAILSGVFLFAAHEGIFGEKLKTLAVTMMPKEKVPEKILEQPKEQPRPKPEVEQPKTEAPKLAQNVAPPSEKSVVSPVSTTAPVAAAPAAEVPSFFDGGKAVETTTDPDLVYKNFVEFTLLSRWNRPENTVDYGYVAEAEITIDKEGRLVNSTWKRGSGDQAWDRSVKNVLSATKALGHPPPKGFPQRVLVRFDVAAAVEASIH